MNLATVGLHPDFPEKVWVVVEQPKGEPHRLRYDRASGSFERTPHKSLTFERGFSGAYGWVGGLGTPPAPHLDVLLLTHQDRKVGDVLLGFVCGVFYRGDGDHKLVAPDAERRAAVARADFLLWIMRRRTNLNVSTRTCARTRAGAVRKRRKLTCARAYHLIRRADLGAIFFFSHRPLTRVSSTLAL